MSQLIKATITPFEAVHFRQNARLVSSGNIDAERRRVVAMQARFQLRYSGNGSVNTRDTSQIRRAFAKGQPQQLSKDAPKAEPVTTTPTEVQPKVSVPETENLTLSAPTAVSDYSAASGSSFSAENAYVEQAQATYDMQKTSFDLRVASGDLSYVPAVDMTIVLQRPGVSFEYMGGFNYVPPSWSPVGENVDMVL